MGAVLSNQLQSVMQEGLLDSLLPYLVRDKKLYKVHISNQSDKSFKFVIDSPKTKVQKVIQQEQEQLSFHCQHCPDQDWET